MDQNYLFLLPALNSSDPFILSLSFTPLSFSLSFSILHYVFANMELAEARGLGLETMMKIAQDASLPLPRYSWEEPYLVLTLHRAVKGIEETLDARILDQLGKSEREGLKWLSTKELVSAAEYSGAQGLEKRAGSLHLKKLVKFGLVEKVGAGRSTKYRFVR